MTNFTFKDKNRDFFISVLSEVPVFPFPNFNESLAKEASYRLLDYYLKMGHLESALSLMYKISTWDSDVNIDESGYFKDSKSLIECINGKDNLYQYFLKNIEQCNLEISDQKKERLRKCIKRLVNKELDPHYGKDFELSQSGYESTYINLYLSNLALSLVLPQSVSMGGDYTTASYGGLLYAFGVFRHLTMLCHHAKHNGRASVEEYFKDHWEDMLHQSLWLTSIISSYASKSPLLGAYLTLLAMGCDLISEGIKTLINYKSTTKNLKQTEDIIKSLENKIEEGKITQDEHNNISKQLVELKQLKLKQQIQKDHVLNHGITKMIDTAVVMSACITLSLLPMTWPAVLTTIGVTVALKVIVPKIGQYFQNKSEKKAYLTFTDGDKEKASLILGWDRLKSKLATELINLKKIIDPGSMSRISKIKHPINFLSNQIRKKVNKHKQNEFCIKLKKLETAMYKLQDLDFNSIKNKDLQEIYNELQNEKWFKKFKKNSPIFSKIMQGQGLNKIGNLEIEENIIKNNLDKKHVPKPFFDCDKEINYYNPLQMGSAFY
ncbi:MAG: hypothetical protein EP298_01750 [Gammaproteobacteria bacterium]|nr:MAG: hypothetical protein EP298_01750 [Gammaproteobacteria bacterium]UTW43929.1 hypothetical protein KFE69_07520 [bacterium SCSIO 12844]